MKYMAHNEPHPQEKETPMTNTNQPKPTIKVEDFGNGITIAWKIHR